MLPRLSLVLLLCAGRLPGAGCDDPGVRVFDERRGDIVHIFVETTNCLDITITLTPELQNMQASAAMPVTVDTKGRTLVELATLRPDRTGEHWHYRYRWQWRYGGRGGQPDGTAYLLPFAAGTHHKLIQGYGGHFSHQAGSANEYAHDWDLAEGTVVSAARDGIVVGLRQDSNSGGVGEAFKQCANYVIIRHRDGTYAEYLHLRQNGVTVKLGDAVRAGQPIAYSGNTGYTSRPHLHFAVFRAIDGSTRETLPVKFLIRGGEAQSLESGRTY